MSIFRTLRGFPLRLWTRVSEPRALSALASVVYLLLGVAGVSALVEQPYTIAGYFGSTAMALIGGMLAYAGVLGVPSALLGIRWVERSALMASFVALTLYAAIVGTLHVLEPGNRLLQTCVIVSLLCTLASRLLHLGHLPYDPELSRVGRRIERERVDTGQIPTPP